MLAAVNRLMERLKLPVNARKTQCLRCPENRHRVPRVSHRLEPSPNGRKPVHWHPTEQGERSEHLPQDQRANGPSVRVLVHRGGCRASQPDDVRVGQLLHGSLQVSPAYRAVDRHATRRLRQWFRRKLKVHPVERLRALLRRMAAADLRLDASWVNDQRPSVGEGMIPDESRMREIRTSGSTSGGVETDRMGAGLSTKRKRGQEAPDPTRHRATPRLYL